MSDKASELMTKTFFGINQRFTSILNFRSVANIGLQEGYEQLLIRELANAHWVFHSKETDDLFIDKTGAIEMLGGVEGLAKTTTEHMANTFSSYVDATSLVFAHSLLDGAAIEYCRVAAIACPSLFLESVLDKKIQFRKTHELHADAILNELVENHLKDLEKTSLPKKIEFIYSICKPTKGQEGIANYVYDPDRIKVLDTLRHDIVHKSGSIQSNEIDKDLTYLRDTSNHLMTLIAFRTGVRMDPQFMLDKFR